MRKGGGNLKGGNWERKVCVQLSLWVTHGQRDDVFWRSAMSGGRATVRRKLGKDTRQAGDLTAIAPEGYQLADPFFFEFKHVKKLDIASFILDGRGELAKFWKKACVQAREHMRRPLLIAKENYREALVICRHRELRMFCLEPPLVTTSFVEIRYLKDVLKTKFPMM